MAQAAGITIERAAIGDIAPEGYMTGDELAKYVCGRLNEKYSKNQPDEIFEPDEDFYRSIPIEEVRDSVHEHIHQLFANR